LGHLVVIKETAHAFGLTVEEVGDAPEKIGEIGFQPCVGEEACGGFEDRRQRLFGSLGRGQGTRIAILFQRAVAVELQLLKEMGRGRHLGL